MVLAAFSGLADVLLRGIDYAQQQRQRQLQEAMLIQQLMGEPEPHTVEVPTEYGVIPMTTDQLIQAGYVGSQPTPPRTIDLGTFLGPDYSGVEVSESAAPQFINAVTPKGTPWQGEPLTERQAAALGVEGLEGLPVGALSGAGTLVDRSASAQQKMLQLQKDLALFKGSWMPADNVREYIKLYYGIDPVLPQPNEKGLVLWDQVVSMNQGALGLGQARANIRATTAEAEVSRLEQEILKVQLQHLPEQLKAEVRQTLARASKDETESHVISETLFYVIEQMKASTALDIARAANLDAQTATEKELKEARHDLLMAETKLALANAGLSATRADEITRLLEPTIAKIGAETDLLKAEGDLTRARGEEAWQRVDEVGAEALRSLIGLPDSLPEGTTIYRWQLDGLRRAYESMSPGTTVPFRTLATQAGIDTSDWPEELANAPVPMDDPKKTAEALRIWQEVLAPESYGAEAKEGEGLFGRPSLPDGSSTLHTLAWQQAQAMAADPSEVPKLADQAIQRFYTAYNAYLRAYEHEHMLFGGIKNRYAPPVLSEDEFALVHFLGEPLPEAGPMNMLDATQRAWILDAIEAHGHPTALREHLEKMNTRQRAQVLEQFGLPAREWDTLMDIVRWMEMQALGEGRFMP